MKIRLTERLRKSYAEAPGAVQKAFDTQARLLADNLHHPSLRAKKYEGTDDVWQVRVNRDWRFYFMIARD